MAKSLNNINRTSPDDLNLKRGMRLGKYRLGKRLGEGGYCEVWKARDTMEGIWVALKIPHIELDGKRDSQSIIREVRLVSQLRHPHITPVKNAEIIDGYAVLATELSSGTLEDCSRPMSVRKIISIVCQVLDGLSCAHKNRIVHCDVTPGNVFMFLDGHAAIGDFGIGQQVKGRIKTNDDFGTPGYVSPEQAYGKPTYRSDCFSVGLILYEYLTGYLPTWPFKWPFRGYDRLLQKTDGEFVKFMKKALSVYPSKRFADAGEMLISLRQVIPKSVARKQGSGFIERRKQDWRQVRRESFLRRYIRVFGVFHSCQDCGEPIAESMTICPWCRSDNNRYTTRTSFSHYCPRCFRGISPEWLYCPWCSGDGFEAQEVAKTAKIKYHAKCKYCNGKVMRFMRYCPWCHRKKQEPWDVWPFPELCSKCGWSIDSYFWNNCPWCGQRLL